MLFLKSNILVAMYNTIISGVAEILKRKIIAFDAL